MSVIFFTLVLLSADILVLRLVSRGWLHGGYGEIEVLCLLCSRVVKLVLPGAGEAFLNPAVSPQPPDHIGQIVWQHALLLRSSRQGKELAGVILQGGETERKHYIISQRENENRHSGMAQCYQRSSQSTYITSFLCTLLVRRHGRLMEDSGRFLSQALSIWGSSCVVED